MTELGAREPSPAKGPVRLARDRSCRVGARRSHVPQAIPEPLPTDHLASDLASDVRYRVDHASDGDLAKLQQCLQRFLSVVGIEFNGPAGS